MIYKNQQRLWRIYNGEIVTIKLKYLHLLYFSLFFQQKKKEKRTETYNRNDKSRSSASSLVIFGIWSAFNAALNIATA